MHGTSPAANGPDGFVVIDTGDRYELREDDDVIAFAPYRRVDDTIVVPYVETRPDRRGDGMAAQLLDGVVDDARRRDLTIRPTCSYAAGYMAANPDTHDVLADRTKET